MDPSGRQRKGLSWWVKFLGPPWFALGMGLACVFLVQPFSRWMLLWYAGLGVLVMLSEDYSPEGWRRTLGHAERFIPILVFLLALVALRNETAPPRFFEAAAQVIPVLTLAILLQGRGMAIRTAMRQMEFWCIVFTIYALAVGEALSFVGIWSDGRTPLAAPAAAVAAGFAGIIVAALAAAPENGG